MTNPILKSISFVILAVVLLSLLACGGGSTASKPPSSSSPPGATPTPVVGPNGKSVTIDIIGEGLVFNLKTLSVPAGAAVTVNFTNKDLGTTHNFSLYQNLPGGQAKAIFIGDYIPGGQSNVNKFTAPSDTQVTYFYNCDNHPQTMFGTWVATP